MQLYLIRLPVIYITHSLPAVSATYDNDYCAWLGLVGKAFVVGSPDGRSLRMSMPPRAPMLRSALCSRSAAARCGVELPSLPLEQVSRTLPGSFILGCTGFSLRRQSGNGRTSG